MTSIADRYDYSCKRHTAPMGCQKWKVFQSYNHFLPAVSSFMIKWTHTTKSTFDLLEFYKWIFLKFWLLQDIPKYFDTWKTVQDILFIKEPKLGKGRKCLLYFSSQLQFLKISKINFMKIFKKTDFKIFFIDNLETPKPVNPKIDLLIL